MYRWIRIKLKDKNTLPPLDETAMFYTETEGRFFGHISAHKDSAGRAQYYYYIGQELGNRAVKGKKIWWQPAPGIPFDAAKSK